MTDSNTNNKLVKYNKVDVAKALTLRLDKGLTYQEIADIQGVKKQSVYIALEKFRHMINNPEVIDSYIHNKSKLLSAAEMEILMKVSDKDVINNASLASLTASLDRLDHINRLEQGKSTANLSYQDVSDSLEEIRKEKAQLLEQLR